VITLLTGAIGSGKTLFGLHLARKYVEEGRQLYVLNVRDFDYNAFGALHLRDDKIENWQEVPDRSVILFDECYEGFPQRTKDRTPQFIQAMATSRHRNIDFILICQEPKQIDVAVRRLVSEHIHCERAFGKDFHAQFRWVKCQERPNEKPVRSGAMKKIWKFDKSNYENYTSAVDHTVKSHVPWKVMAIPVLLVCVVILAVLFLYTMRSISHANGSLDKLTQSGHSQHSGAPLSSQGLDLSPEKVGGQLGIQSSGNGSKIDFSGASALDYAKLFQPRIKGFLWSAQAYSQTPPSEIPATYCVMFDSNSSNSLSSIPSSPDSSSSVLTAPDVGGLPQRKCRCYTEQVTPIEGLSDAQCREIALHGYYDPFKTARQKVLASAQPAQQSSPSPAAVSSLPPVPTSDFQQVLPTVPGPGQSSQHRPLSAPFDAGVFRPKTRQF
jgi:zona occludens toxin